MTNRAAHREQDGYHKVRESTASRVRDPLDAMSFGTALLAEGGVRFSIWAPAQSRVQIALDGLSELFLMHRREGGWHTLDVRQAQAGSRYQFVLQDGRRVPDPGSRYQPNDVHEASEVIDPESYRWKNNSWRGRPWHELVFYELHVGTLTPKGTFRAALAKLDYLVDLGVTAIELMPVNDFPGQHSWGYDGVLPFAPDSRYGRPEDLKALIDAAHGKGLMVFLDVVYNHFGPEGNYLPLYAPAIYTDRHTTPWGKAINFDGADSREVRELIIQNALYWLEEFRFDGLRLDAVHAIVDDSPKHILLELAERVQSSVDKERPVYLVLENYLNQSHWLPRTASNEPQWYAAQWNDDLHHGLHVAATGESGGYYMDYAGGLQALGRALAEGFSYQGEVSKFANGQRRGEPSASLPPVSFVSFLQNHDQIGNRAFGERIMALAQPEALRAIAAIYLLAPQIPMLFMGEEWASASPFPFFCDVSGELREAVREGRRKEFASFPEFRDPAKQAQIPDPIARSTFESAKLRWDEVDREPHREWLQWYRRILQVRKAEIVPHLENAPGSSGTYEISGNVLKVQWRLAEDYRLRLHACLSNEPAVARFEPPGQVIWREGEFGNPWSVICSVSKPFPKD